MKFQISSAFQKPVRLNLSRLWPVCLGAVPCLAAFQLAAQVASTNLFPPNEPVCGYAENFQSLQPADVKQGLAVGMLVGDAQAGVAMPLRFRVLQKPLETPVDELQVEHEKLMHVIGVRDDLGGFFHIHPQRVGPGLWQVLHTFTNGGRYQIWSDVKQRGVLYSFAQPRLVVGGNPATARVEAATKLEDAQSGYTVTLRTPENLIAGATNQLRVLIRNESGTPVGTDFFLGSLMHLVVIKDDLTSYHHAHVDGHTKGSIEISFNHVFPQPGGYKIFAQFRPLKTKLAPDDAVLAQFHVKVRGSK